MENKLAKALKDANKELKKRKFLLNYELEIDGDFTTIYNDLRLNKDGHCFPISNVETEGEAIAAIRAYMSGFSHGQDKSYVRLCDNNNYYKPIAWL